METRVIEELLLDMAECTDLGGYPLFDNRIVSILGGGKEACVVFTGSRGVALYTVTGHITKGDGAASAPLCKRYYLPHWNHSTCTWPAM